MRELGEARAGGWVTRVECRVHGAVDPVAAVGVERGGLGGDKVVLVQHSGIRVGKGGGGSARGGGGDGDGGECGEDAAAGGVGVAVGGYEARGAGGRVADGAVGAIGRELHPAVANGEARAGEGKAGALGGGDVGGDGGGEGAADRRVGPVRGVGGLLGWRGAGPVVEDGGGAEDVEEHADLLDIADRVRVHEARDVGQRSESSLDEAEQLRPACAGVADKGASHLEAVDAGEGGGVVGGAGEVRGGGGEVAAARVEVGLGQLGEEGAAVPRQRPLVLVARKQRREGAIVAVVAVVAVVWPQRRHHIRIVRRWAPLPPGGVGVGGVDGSARVGVVGRAGEVGVWVEPLELEE